MGEKSRIVYFLAAGSTGFVIDATILTALVSLAGWSPYAARIVSFSVAVTATWYINRRFTFGDRPAQHIGHEYLKYLLVQGVGVAINYGVFSAVVFASAYAARLPVLALIPASLLAMFATYLGMHRFAFPRAVESGS
jgi:putative flippase GtrA